MITKTDMWDLIKTSLKEARLLDNLTSSVMKKIRELDSKNAKNTNK